MKVAFDFDGTLVDSMLQLERIAQACTTRYGAPWFTERYRETVGMSFREQLEEIFPDDSRNVQTADVFERCQQEIYATVRPRRLAYSALLLCADPCVVSSSGYRMVKEVMHREFIDRPDVRVLARRYGTKTEQLKHVGAHALIGDALRDANYAAEAGVQFVGVHGIFSAEDFAGIGARSAGDPFAAWRMLYA